MGNKSTSTMLILAMLLGNIPAIVYSQDIASVQNPVKKRDYYFEGEDAAESDYTGGSATAAGLVSGLFLSVMGWGLGYVIIAGSDVDVPSHYLRDMDSRDRRDFQDGYRHIVMRRKKAKFNAAAGIGTVVGLVFFIAADGF